MIRVGMTNFGFLYRRSLESSLEAIAGAGFRLVEITPAPPQILVTELDRDARMRLRKRLDDLGLTCVSVNGTELNLISPNREIRELALRQYRACIALASDLGAGTLVLIPGRQSPLIPMPREESWTLAVDQVGLLARDAAESGVDLAVESVPFGFAETAADVVALAGAVGHARVGVALDVANIFGREDVPEAVATAGRHLKIAHLSDTWRDHWAHTSLGRGEVDFREYIAALESAGFAGPCIYELVDGDDPQPRLAGDLEKLEQLGLSR